METNLITKLQELHDFFINQNIDNINIYVISILIGSALLIVILSKKIKVPIVVGYVFLGIILSIDTIDSLPFLSTDTKKWYALALDILDFIPQIALAFIAFTVGSELSVKLIKKMGKSIFYISIFQALISFILVALSLFAIGQELYLSLIFGAIASATAPATTLMVLKEYNASGPITSVIMAVSGIGDGISLILFSLISPIAYILFSGQGQLSFINSLGIPLLEIIFSITIGLISGYLSQKYLINVEEKTKKVLAIISTIVGTTAIAIFFHLSPLITNMAIGFAYRNFSRKNLGISDYLETLTIPLFAMFFVFAGTKIQFHNLTSTTFIVLAIIYTLSRTLGKIGGSSLAASITKTSKNVKKYVGIGLLTQSGIAIALAYSVQTQYSNNPHIGLLVFNIILFTSILTEVFGPIAIKYVIFKTGEAKKHNKNK